MQQSRSRKGRDVCGIVLLDKPGGMTSNRALQRVKRLFDARKAGHTGSLDPLATGLLPICFGGATKLSGYLLDAGKTYSVTAKFGVATDTADADGQVTGVCEQPAPDIDRVRQSLARFCGDLEQVPPMYSALKQGGRRLYELARQGVEVERPARPVRIYSIVLDDYQWPHCSFTVQCSKGTYVRTLVVDIAASLDTLGHVSALRRLALGPFEARQMVTVDALEEAAQAGEQALDRFLLPPAVAVADWRQVEVNGEQASKLRHGMRIPAEPHWPPGKVAIMTVDRGLMGLGEVTTAGELAPQRLL
jgi:tRNA pseudouridine55 synthase